MTELMPVSYAVQRSERRRRSKEGRETPSTMGCMPIAGGQLSAASLDKLPSPLAQRQTPRLTLQGCQGTGHHRHWQVVPRHQILPALQKSNGGREHASGYHQTPNLCSMHTCRVQRSTGAPRTPTAATPSPATARLWLPLPPRHRCQHTRHQPHLCPAASAAPACPRQTGPCRAGAAGAQQEGAGGRGWSVSMGQTYVMQHGHTGSWGAGLSMQAGASTQPALRQLLLLLAHFSSR